MFTIIGPLDIQRLAVRIERLQQVHTHDWRGGDDLEFKNLLPGGRDRRALPDPKVLRAMTDSPAMIDWQLWITMTSRMEGMIHQNDPRNPRNQMRDMMHNMSRGLPPGWRR